MEAIKRLVYCFKITLRNNEKSSTNCLASHDDQIDQFIESNWVVNLDSR